MQTAVTFVLSQGSQMHCWVHGSIALQEETADVD